MNQHLRTIRRPEVLSKTGLSKTTIHNLCREGKFPKSFLITPRCAVWVEAEVDDWIQARRGAPANAAPAPDHTRRAQFPGRGKARAW